MQQRPKRRLDMIDRRAVLGMLATGVAALTLGEQEGCSSTTTVVQNGGNDSGAGDDGSTGDDGSAGDDASSSCTPSGSDQGPVTNYPQGKWVMKRDFIIAHDANGLYAYTNTCTHEGCTIDAPNTSGTATCPCHGAQFDGNGKVLRGPASTPLEHYALQVCNGHVYVNSSKTVSATTRTPAA